MFVKIIIVATVLAVPSLAVPLEQHRLKAGDVVNVCPNGICVRQIPPFADPDAIDNDWDGDKEYFDSLHWNIGNDRNHGGIGKRAIPDQIKQDVSNQNLAKSESPLVVVSEKSAEEGLPSEDFAQIASSFIVDSVEKDPTKDQNDKDFAKWATDVVVDNVEKEAAEDEGEQESAMAASAALADSIEKEVAKDKSEHDLAKFATDVVADSIQKHAGEGVDDAKEKRNGYCPSANWAGGNCS